MKIVVFGGAGLLGSAIVGELRSHGHSVITAGRSGCDKQVDFRSAHSAEDFAPLVEDADVVINAVGILIERGDERFDTVHVAAPRALFEACAQAHVARVVHISALGTRTAEPVVGRYMASKRAAEAALIETMANSRGDAVIVRPSLLMSASSPSTQLFQWLARLPIITLPGLLSPGHARLAPMLCADAAAAICRICEHPKALHRAIELAGPQELSYREFLAQLRSSQGLDSALWLPLPWALLRWMAKLAEFFPQKVISSDGMRLLKAGLTAERNEALYWLRCMPKPVIAGIAPA
ncbi:NAD-dependent epimerase/dehydratase family protein [Variovorax sp. PCZ-1]|uniref:NAD-dependent epimerase/dehydratase family protein n=1 Tax=Variovorax sp. PCZ-1 TaxID=2835533 RepID=UPI001BD12842|nr:NAD-dependent epimerase/dehydratase family protein [Variovorax sp. PCZ-1]MBS7808439.1 NAD(P)H-binding protein [Variovorax sp. PCZ-1]